VTLLARVAAVLWARHIDFAAIGAVAMAAHGVGRSTLDIDLFTTDPAVLAPDLWSAVDAAVDLRRGDADDPLAGVVRLTAGRERPVDVIVGRHAWQRDLIRRARPTTIADAIIPVVDVGSLILLKLYAGGTQDAWDIEQLLGAATDRQTLVATVEGAVGQLPEPSRGLWQRLR
jgi:hypothetical protein